MTWQSDNRCKDKYQPLGQYIAKHLIPRPGLNQVIRIILYFLNINAGYTNSCTNAGGIMYNKNIRLISDNSSLTHSTTESIP